MTKIGDEFEYELIFIPDGKKVGLSSIQKATDKKGEIHKKDLAEKVEEKKNKGEKKKKKDEIHKKDESKMEEVTEPVKKPSEEVAQTPEGHKVEVEAKLETNVEKWEEYDK